MDCERQTATERLLPALQAVAVDEALPLTVRGGSMQPLLHAGQRVQVVRDGRYYPGDVVAFQSHDGALCIHRLLGYRPRAGRWHIVARGDAAPNCDAPVPLAQLLGKVVAIDAAPWRPGFAARVQAITAFVTYLVTTITGYAKRNALSR